MKKNLLIIGVLFVCTLCTAQTAFRDGVSLGIGAGFTNYKTVAPEVFLQLNKKIGRRLPLEIKIGLDHRKFDATFAGISDLPAEGVGLFGEATVYPFQKWFYAGLRWNIITVNWLTGNALNRIGSGLSSNVFAGTNIYAVAGVDVPVFKSMSFRVYAMPGLQQYKISDGSFSSGDYIVDGTVQEGHFKFAAQVNAAIVFHF
ncbi:hypothetical protein FACS189429_5110 [Bacteroidia bacterium]|nr:hypothetical protein FACS189429_5110 [Bacteroidia bacterium]